MASFFFKFEPADIIALVVVIGGLALKFTGADGLVGSLLTAIVFYYFGKKRFYDNEQNNQSSVCDRGVRGLASGQKPNI